MPLDDQDRKKGLEILKKMDLLKNDETPVSKDLQIYCEKFDCSGIILRPDKYVFDLFKFNKSDSLETIINDVLINIREKIEFNWNTVIKE